MFYLIVMFLTCPNAAALEAASLNDQIAQNQEEQYNCDEKCQNDYVKNNENEVLDFVKESQND